MTVPKGEALKQALFVPAIFLLLYMTAVVFRPLIPIDETRYITVAWEMYLRHDWLAPLTVNFQPYHHKPPLLFWLMNGAWGALGVSRWAATIPVVLSAMISVYLTRALAGRILPEGQDRVMLVMLGSLPFLLYATLILFDLTMTVFVLAALLCLYGFAQNRRIGAVLLMGLFLGLGVLTKGPVAYLYVIFPVLLGPYWAKGSGSWLGWYMGFIGAVLVSVIPIMVWLVPVLKSSSGDFAYWLLWEQTAGRVSGSYGEAHTRPVYFYLPLIPVMLMPWIFLPAFWRGIRQKKEMLAGHNGFKFLLSWLVPTFIAFSLIGGKQPHYLVPLLPGIMMLLAFSLKDLQRGVLVKTVLVMTVVFITGHMIAAQTAFKAYDLAPIAAFVQEHPDHDFAFVRNYHGEVTYLARLEKPVDSLERNHLGEWFENHPEGWAIIRYRIPEEVEDYKMLMSVPYRGKRLGIFSSRHD